MTIEHYRCTRCGLNYSTDQAPPTCDRGPCPMELVSVERPARFVFCRILKAWRDRREQKRADAYALESYRLQITDMRRWLTEFPDVYLMLESMQTLAGDRNSVAYDLPGLRDMMRRMRAKAGQP